jgi:hypothetical protein
MPFLVAPTIPKLGLLCVLNTQKTPTNNIEASPIKPNTAKNKHQRVLTRSATLAKSLS